VPDLPIDFNAAAGLAAAALLAAGVALCALAVAFVAKVLDRWLKWRR